ncbi:MAG: lipid II flippase MurJ [Planctomycetaceae bacterium]
MTTNRDVAVAGISLAGLAVFCRLVSLAKELYIASEYGASIAFDVYALAMLIPALGIAVIAQSARRGYLSFYARFALEGQDSLHRFERHFFKLLGVGAVIAAVGLGTIFSLPWNRWLPWPLPALERLAEISWYSASLLIPMTLVIGLSTLLNARKEFVVTQLTHVFPPVVTVLLVISFPDRRGALLLIMGLLIGSILQAGVLMWNAFRHGISIFNITKQQQPRMMTEPATYSVFTSVILVMIVLEILNQGNVSVDRLMAGVLPEGNVTMLYWSALMKDFVTGTIIASLLTVQFPHMSEQAARTDYTELKRSCSLTLRYGAIFIFPFTVLLIVGVMKILPLLSIGKLDETAMLTIAPCFAAYAFGFFADLASTSLSQALMALRRLRTLIWIGIFGYFVPNVIFNSLLIGKFGVVGLAASTSFVGYCTLICNFIALRKVVGPLADERRTWGVIAISAAAAALMSLAAWGSLIFLEPILSGTSVKECARVGVACAVGLAVYLLALMMSPARMELMLLTDILRKKLGRRRS